MEHRGYKIEADSFGMRSIKPIGKGSVHKSLRGKFTKPDLAMAEIDRYEDAKPKGKTNVETADAS